MVYEFVLKLFGKGAVEMISLLPFLLVLSGDRFQTDIVVTKPYTSEIVRFVKAGHSVTFACEQSLVINKKHRFVKREQSELSYRDGQWKVNGKAVGTAVPGQMKFRFSYSGFRFDSGDKLELFAVVTIVDDPLFEQSTGFRTAVFWNYATPSKLSRYRFEKEHFVDDH